MTTALGCLLCLGAWAIAALLSRLFDRARQNGRCFLCGAGGRRMARYGTWVFAQCDSCGTRWLKTPEGVRDVDPEEWLQPPPEPGAPLTPRQVRFRNIGRRPPS